MALEQSARVQECTSRGLIKVNLQMLLVYEPNGSIAVVIAIGKLSVRRLGAWSIRSLDVTSTTGNDVHRGLGVIHSVGVGDAIIDRRETLRVVDMSEHAQVHAVLVEDILERGLARGAAVAGAGAVPGSVAGNNHPRCHSAVNAGQVRLEEVGLLVGLAEGPAVQLGRAVGSIGRIGEVGLGVDHDDVGHAVFERVPEWGVSEAAGLRGEILGGGVGRGRSEGGRHGVLESVHEVGKVLLTLRTQVEEVGDLRAVGLVVARAGHVQLAACNGRELVVELLEDSLVGFLAVEEVVELEVPVVGVGKVTGVDDDLVVIDGPCKSADGGVVQLGLDHGGSVSLRCGVAVLAVDTQVDDHVHAEGGLVTGSTGTQEVLYAGVARHNLVVVGRGRGQSSQHRIV